MYCVTVVGMIGGAVLDGVRASTPSELYGYQYVL
jgi:hypothetical protein